MRNEQVSIQPFSSYGGRRKIISSLDLVRVLDVRSEGAVAASGGGVTQVVLLVKGLEHGIALEEDVALEPPRSSLGDLVVGELGGRDLCKI